MAYYRGVAGDFTTVHYNRNFILSVFTLTRFHCSYVLTAQTMGQWKTACDSLAQTRETAQIYGSRILIAPPTNAFTQYK